MRERVNTVVGIFRVRSISGLHVSRLLIFCSTVFVAALQILYYSYKYLDQFKYLGLDQFKYLGSVIAANGGVEADVHHRVNEGCKVLGALKGVMKIRGLGMNVKKVLYEKVVVPTVMYGSESWGMKVTERQKLNVFEMKCLRSMTGVSRLDRVRNEVVRARTGVRRELAARVDVNVLRWFGHVERMDNERLLKKVMNAKVDGRSARGRPRFGWMDGVKRALNDRRMDISERARNRNEWQMIVTQF